MSAHPKDGNYPVMVAVNNMTGVWEEFALEEHQEFDEWKSSILARGWSIKKALLHEVLQNLDDYPSAKLSS